MTINIEFPTRIESNFKGYQFLTDLYHETKSLMFDDVFLDFTKMNWFEGNLTAPLGAILNSIQNNLNEIYINHLSPSIENLLERNYFLSYFGGKKKVDHFKTTIKYRNLKTTDGKIFKECLDTELFSQEVMQEISPLLKKQIQESIFEILDNAIIHAQCKNFFSCGQHYPTKKRIDFTLVNLGKTIQENVSEFLNREINGEEAIRWAVTEGHTTKKNSTGGLGLALIQQFLKFNKGKLQIISGDGYWEQGYAKDESKTFSKFFSGTIINFEFNTTRNGENRHFDPIEKEFTF